MIAAIITEDAALRTRLDALLQTTANVDSVLIIPEYPDAVSIHCLDDRDLKYVAFIDFEGHSERALALSAEINRSCPSVAAVALHVGSSQADMIATVRAGVCEVRPQPFSEADIATALVASMRKLAGSPMVPASDGTGTGRKARFAVTRSWGSGW